MAEKEQVKVVTAKQAAAQPGGMGGFQSKAAFDAAVGTKESEEGDETEDGEVALKPEDLEKLVKVRPRTTHNNIRFGQKTFNLAANKWTLVPLALKMHLEEKGVL